MNYLDCCHMHREILANILQMGSICSKSSVHEGGHTLLGPSNTAAPNATPSDPRTAAAQAAERRIQAVSICHHEYSRLLEFIFRLNERA